MSESTDRVVEQLDMLICPRCDSTFVVVDGDGSTRRRCKTCFVSWLPDEDHPLAGGPYIQGWVEKQKQTDA